MYHGDGLGRIVATRMCKGDANKPSSSIVCTVITGINSVDSIRMRSLTSMATGQVPETRPSIREATPARSISAPHRSLITLFYPTIPLRRAPMVEPQYPPTGCNQIDNQETLRCSFAAKDLLPNGCKSGQPVNILVSGNVFSPETERDVKFLSTDSPTCNIVNK